MGRVGISLNNRLVKHFFSILKQEYLFDECENFKELKQIINESIYDYNNKRFRSKLKNITPHEFGMSYNRNLNCPFLL